MKTTRALKPGRCRGCPWHTPPATCCDRALKSGRCGDWVWYLRGGNQFRRRYVKPRDPRTASQLRSRAALASASKDWGHALTKADRQVCSASGAKQRNHPRLGQSGLLTGQQSHVSKSCKRSPS